MRLRLICREQDCNAAANVNGASADVFHRTFDVDAPKDLATWLLAVSRNSLCTRTIAAVEIISEPNDAKADEAWEGV